MTQNTEELELITGKELCGMFRISLATLYRHLKGGPPKERNHGISVNVQMIPDYRIGGKRLWSKAAAKELLAENRRLNR